MNEEVIKEILDEIMASKTCGNSFDIHRERVAIVLKYDDKGYTEELIEAIRQYHCKGEGCYSNISVECYKYSCLGHPCAVAMYNTMIRNTNKTLDKARSILREA